MWRALLNNTLFVTYYFLLRLVNVRIKFVDPCIILKKIQLNYIINCFKHLFILVWYNSVVNFKNQRISTEVEPIEQLRYESSLEMNSPDLIGMVSVQSVWHSLRALSNVVSCLDTLIYIESVVRCIVNQIKFITYSTFPLLDPVTQILGNSRCLKVMLFCV